MVKREKESKANSVVDEEGERRREKAEKNNNGEQDVKNKSYLLQPQSTDSDLDHVGIRRLLLFHKAQAEAAFGNTLLKSEEKKDEKKEKSSNEKTEIEEKEENHDEKPTKEEESEPKDEPKIEGIKDISICGVPLLPTKSFKGTDVIILKLLRAREFKVNETFEMLKRTLIWRAHSEIETILEEDLGLRFMMKEVRSATYKAIGLLQGNYPEMVARNVRGEVSDIVLKLGSAETIKIAAPELRFLSSWSNNNLDIAVLGWEVSYKEEFIPTNEGSYTIIIQKEKNMDATEELVHSSFRNNEPSRVVLTIVNHIKKKKQAFYHYKI
ncbi:hypothetical protein Cgig2_003649 [Carnegiea gigantea]|uniref:CRAL/TRIO N-terminal domain-containing protein n=1 Tax=Carnegiea gigantea TaxID=171969 RepID=A0A9Q1GU05_9CARY|nr:hypothetical protein Cgig2_003649 [Carnegiea gigantea]